MTWSRSVTSPEGETLRDSFDKVDLSDLKPQYQEQFRAACITAEHMLANDEVPDGELTISMTGYASPAYPPATGENRSVSVQILGAPVYVESAPIDESQLGSSH